MASKCWFVLSQTHYPPPILPKHGVGLSTGPLCLGHIIPGIRRLDNVINRNGPLELPPNIPIHSTKAWGLRWEQEDASGVGLSATTGIPIAAVAGLNVKLDAGIAFQTTVRKFWEFDSLDTFIIQPTNAYVEESLESEEVAKYLADRGLLKSSTLFMITGIVVARGAAFNAAKARSHNISAGPGVELPMVVEVGTQVESSNAKSRSSSAQETTDFVWAVRLARISRGFLDRKWAFETMSHGATFGFDKESDISRDIKESLEQEGMFFDECQAGADDDIFILGSDIA